MKIEEFEIFSAWLAQEFRALTKDKFLDEVYRVVTDWEQPSDWVLSYIASGSWDELWGSTEFCSDDLLKLSILKNANIKYCFSSMQMKLALESLFLCEEYGAFESPDEELNCLYESYQAPKFEIEESELLQMLSQYFKSA